MSRVSSMDLDQWFEKLRDEYGSLSATNFECYEIHSHPPLLAFLLAKSAGNLGILFIACLRRSVGRCSVSVAFDSTELCRLKEIPHAQGKHVGRTLCHTLALIIDHFTAACSAH